MIREKLILLKQHRTFIEIDYVPEHRANLSTSITGKNGSSLNIESWVPYHTSPFLDTWERKSSNILRY